MKKQLIVNNKLEITVKEKDRKNSIFAVKTQSGNKFIKRINDVFFEATYSKTYPSGFMIHDGIVGMNFASAVKNIYNENKIKK